MTGKGSPRVWNRRDRDAPRGAVYVGRPTLFGNPYVVGKDGSRELVIEKYRARLLSSPALVKAARERLRGKDLVCWCAPLPCHADVLLEVANG